MTKEQILNTIEPRSVKIIIALQSEGRNWGSNGLQAFGEDYFNSGYMIDCFSFLFDTKLVPASDNFSIWAEVLRWFRFKWNLATGFA